MDFYSFLFKQVYGVVKFFEEWSSMPKVELRVFTTVIILSFFGWMNLASIFHNATDLIVHLLFGLVCYSINHTLFIHKNKYRKALIQKNSSYLNLVLSSSYVLLTTYFFVKTH